MSSIKKRLSHSELDSNPEMLSKANLLNFPKTLNQVQGDYITG